MIYDLFYFNNELDLLEIRLEILDKHVDYFLLCEARETFSGITKPLYYLENKERFARWNHKILHYIPEWNEDLEAMAWASPNTGNGEHWWIREFIQKESARYALTHLLDDDIVYISDVDEIWNPDMKLDYTKDIVYKPKQLPYLYYLNQRTDEDWLGWTGTTCCKYKFIKNGIINHIRTDGLQDYEVVEKGGWHFNALGGKEKKVDAFKHPVYYDSHVWDSREVNMRKDESDLPEYILNNKNQWKKYLL